MKHLSNEVLIDCFFYAFYFDREALGKFQRSGHILRYKDNAVIVMKNTSNTAQTNSNSITNRTTDKTRNEATNEANTTQQRILCRSLKSIERLNELDYFSCSGDAQREG